MPGSMSTTTVCGLPAFCRRGQGVDVGGMVDHHHQVLHLGLSAIRRSIACGVTGEVMCRLSMPASPSASASPSLAQHRRARRRRSGGGRCRQTCGSWNAAAGSPCAPWRRTPSPRCCGRASPDRAPAPACSASAAILLADEMAVKFLGFAHDLSLRLRDPWPRRSCRGSRPLS